MKMIIISDLHNRVNWIESFLSSFKHDKVVFLGDYFDEFNDTLNDIQKSAEWLKQSLQNPNRIHLMGTHDMWYRFLNPFLRASGNNEGKWNIINDVLIDKDWSKLRLFHFEQDFLLTHAGLHQSLLGKHKFSIDYIKFLTDNALSDIKNNKENQLLGAGFARKGSQPFGGITWLDWNKEFEPIPNLNQIVGHTTFEYLQMKHTKSSRNYNLDTKNKHIGILENGNFSWISNIFLQK